MTRVQQVSTVKIFSQEDFDHFASLSGDNNPIHTDPDFCAATRFGRTVAHGLLLCSVLRGLIEQLTPGARLDEQAVMFPAPTCAGGGINLALEVKRMDDGVVTCQGHARVVT